MKLLAIRLLTLACLPAAWVIRAVLRRFPGSRRAWRACRWVAAFNGPLLWAAGRMAR